jgi:hypothetical protein
MTILSTDDQEIFFDPVEEPRNTQVFKKSGRIIEVRHILETFREIF